MAFRRRLLAKQARRDEKKEAHLRKVRIAQQNRFNVFGHNAIAFFSARDPGLLSILQQQTSTDRASFSQDFRSKVQSSRLHRDDAVSHRGVRSNDPEEGNVRRRPSTAPAVGRSASGASRGLREDRTFGMPVPQSGIVSKRIQRAQQLARALEMIAFDIDV